MRSGNRFSGKTVTDLPLSDFLAAHSAFQEDVVEVFPAEASVEARVTPGGTAREAQHAQLALALQVLGG
jgi:argininosuccinate lyase